MMHTGLSISFIYSFHRFFFLNSSIEYVGIQTEGGRSSDFSEIKATIAATLDNNNIRSRRRLSVIYKALKVYEEINHEKIKFIFL